MVGLESAALVTAGAPVPSYTVVQVVLPPEAAALPAAMEGLLAAFICRR
jgi:hypothetical protein